VSGPNFFPKTQTEVDAASLKVEKARLEVVAGPDRGRSHEFQGRVRIGTRPIAEVQLKDPKVSGLHCEILVRGEMTVRDLDSKNGTFLGGFRVREAVVPPGQTISLGNTQIRIVPTGTMVEVKLSPTTSYHGIVGRSAAIRALTAQIERLRDSTATLLIEGETGTGKETVAEALHASSTRADKPLVVVDCASLPPNLIESHLFGHERGAFTGAEQRHEGAFERAASGTLFLDEIGELPLELQTKLLRVLEQKEIQRVGGTRPLRVDVRVIAATNRDLALEVSRGRFREDLYYRLSVVHLHVPPLRERKEDLPLLAIEFLRQLGMDASAHLTAETFRELERHDWPGNVRELRNTLVRAVTLMEPPKIEAERPDVAPDERIGEKLLDLSVPLPEGRAKLVAEYERAYLGKLLTECNGNISEVARRAQLDRMSVYRLLERHNLRGVSK
jgi:DNA-binding NtrC family response regulator